MPLTVATWNINSVRLRLAQVERYLAETGPDVLCLQEIKCRDEQFPARDLAAAGYPHQAVYGFKGYNGVAIVSRRPLERIERHDFCGRSDARALSAHVDGVAIENFYIPAGGDVPDPAANEKFAQKLAFLAELDSWIADARPRADRRILVGDLNVAPLETDVWSHKALLDVVSHTPVETEALERLRTRAGFHDVMREIVPADRPLFTWWSYRAQDWRASNRGRRLDHVWASAALAGTWRAMSVRDETRDWDRPSDHVPVAVTFDV